VSTIIQDLRFAYRTLRKGWWVSALAVVSLAVAIGGNTAVFSLINALIFRPLPYAEPDRIVIFQEREHSTPPSLGNFLTSLPVYADLSERSQTTTDAAVFSPGTFRLQGAERVQTVGGARVTQGFFETLGVDARRGRVFLPEEGVEGGPRVVVLTHEYSERTGGAEEDPIGTVMILDGEPHEVVGVLPPGFDFLVANVDVWVPLTRSPRSAPRTRRNIITLARMTPTATMEQVRIEAKALGEQFAAEYPQVQSDWAVDAFNLRHDLPTGRSRTLMALLQATVLSVLLIACLNITNLLLARSQDRKQELAIRVALGAGQGRLVRQILTESSLLAVTGALGGIGLGWWGIRLISTELASRLPPTWSPVLDVRVLAFTLGISVLASLAFGLAPALGAGRAAPSEQLKEGGVRTTGPGRRQWMGKALVVGEIALCLLALGGGGLLMSGLRELQNPDAGFEQEGILTAQVTLPETGSKVGDPMQARSSDGAKGERTVAGSAMGGLSVREESRLLLARFLDEVRSLPGVRDASWASAPPLALLASSDTFRVPSTPVDESRVSPRANVVRVSPGYAGTLGVHVLEGRFFEEGDGPDNEPVAVVSRSLAEAHFGMESPIGQPIRIQSTPRRIIGVLAEVRQEIFRVDGASNPGTVYLPVDQGAVGSLTLLIRVDGDPRLVAEPLRAAFQRTDPDVALAQVSTLEELLDQFYVGIRVFNAVLSGFGVLALLLAALGVYGMLAYSVSRRRREIGLRMAIGAETHRVVGMVLGEGLKMAGIGLLLGAIVTIPVGVLLQSLFQGVSTLQWETLLFFGSVLLGTTLLASASSASGAARVDPVKTLAGE